MKIIHCADLHLESKMTAVLPDDKARERRSELLDTFERMVAYAAENGVSAVIVAGDMFDTKKVSLAARGRVRSVMTAHPELEFYCLRGNHDGGGFAVLSDPPANLRLFGPDWTTYSPGGGVYITGAEPEGGVDYSRLSLDESKVNIVVMHGQESDVDSPDTVCLRQLRGRGIDYLALGHVHSYKEEKLDGRGRYCYSGCLEGRGFDECGEHGFVVLDIDGRDVKTSFVPFARRRLRDVETDITGCMTTDEIIARVRRRLGEEGASKEDLVKLVLVGRVDVECEKDPDLLISGFKDEYYFVRLDDRSALAVDPKVYERDISLKGEFVRTVMAENGLSDEDKAEIIRCGLMALAGEEVRP